MNNQINANTMLNLLLSASMKKIFVPTDFHDQAQAVKEIMKDDFTGLVDSLTDFSVNTASVDWTLDTKNETLNRILNKWLDTINIEYLGQVPPGIKSLSREYYKERWKASSFPVLKIQKWGEIEGIMLPTKMYFVDGGSVYAEEKDKKSDVIKLFNYNYFLGEPKNKQPLDPKTSKVLLTKPYGRWFDEYPQNFIVKRGVYHNWAIIKLLKGNQADVLSQIVPYMLTLKKGTDVLAKENIKIYSDTDLKEITANLERAIQAFQDSTSSTKTNKAMIRATQYDEELKHLIPDLSTLFKGELFEVLERNILAGLGFIDIVEATSSSRKESILNPKVFIEEVKQGVSDFKSCILTPMIHLIKQKNESHAKYMTNLKVNIAPSPVKGFMSIEFKKEIQRLWRAGRLSDQTAIEMIGEVEFETEVIRKKKEAKRGLDATFYPPLTENREGVATDIPTETKKDFDDNGNEITPEKTDTVEKEDFKNASETSEGITSTNDGHSHKYIIDDAGDGQTEVIDNHSHIIFNGDVEEADGHTHTLLKVEKSVTKKKEKKKKKSKKVKDTEYSELTGSPFKTIKELPNNVRESMSSDLQGTFIRVFNKTYNEDEQEDKAFKIAWTVIKQISRLDKNGKFTRKRKRISGKLEPVVASQEIVEDAIHKTETEIMNTAIKQLQLENAKDRSKLLKKLTKQNEQEDQS